MSDFKVPTPRCQTATALETSSWQLLLNFADLQVLIDGQNGVANRGVGRSWRVMSDDGKVGAFAAFDFVGVAVALSASEIHGARRGEVVAGTAMAVGSDESTLGLRDLHEVHPHAGEADGLRRSGAGVRGWHPFKIEEIDPAGDGKGNQERYEVLHRRSVARQATAYKWPKGQ
jgi:hypothetical protein